MTSLYELMTDTVAELTAAGIRATADPQRVNVPAVLVLPPRLDLDVACGGTATCQAMAIARGPASEAAWKAIDEIVGKMYEIFAFETIEPTSYALDDTAALPAFVVTWTKAIEWP